MPRSIPITHLWGRLQPLVPLAEQRFRKPRWPLPLIPEANAAAAPSVQVDSPRVTGDVRIHKSVASNILKNMRDVWVYLPPGYEAHPDRRYPVLYMHDGNNLFDPEAAFGGQAWNVDDTAEWMIETGQLPPMIVVGVANTPDRLAEYTWSACEQLGGGKGQDYARFLVEEVKPFIDTHYRTRIEREHTGVMGSSLGGLISLYLGAHYGDVFGKVGAMSPSIWWNRRAVLQDLAGIRTDLKIWLDMGSQEGAHEAEWAQNLEDAVSLRKLLEQNGFVDGDNLVWWAAEGACHSEGAWACRSALALSYLFSDGEALRQAA